MVDSRIPKYLSKGKTEGRLPTRNPPKIDTDSIDNTSYTLLGFFRDVVALPRRAQDLTS